MQQEYIMLIMNCKKYIKKAEAQRSTWLKNVPSYLKYYHVIGDETIETPYKFDDNQQILWVKTPDDYNSLPKKVIAAFSAIHETFDFKYLFKTDDDQMLTNPQFFDALRRVLDCRTPQCHYGGYIVDLKRNIYSQYHTVHRELPHNLPLYKTRYCSGRFYFLSRGAVGCLVQKRNLIEREYFEDYAIGYHLGDIFKKHILSIDTGKLFKDMI